MSGVGGALIARDLATLSAWWHQAIDELCPESHGADYAHRFVALEHEDYAVGFYVIDGYATVDEGLAFAHAFFVLDEFLEVLDDTRPPNAFAFAGVGPGVPAEEGIGDLARGLRALGLTLPELGTLREAAALRGTVVWTLDAL